jgi:hypothetical protein
MEAYLSCVGNGIGRLSITSIALKEDKIEAGGAKPLSASSPLRIVG